MKHDLAPVTIEWTDEFLLSEVLKENKLAWKEMIRRFRPLIYRCIQKVLCRFQSTITNVDSDEIYADVLISLVRNDMKKLRLYDSKRGTQLSSWIGMISVNATYDYLRQVARRPALDKFDGVVERGDNSERSPLTKVLEKERWEHLNDALRNFSAKDRRFLDLYYAKGLSPEVIAKRMAISLKTVYSKKHKIRQHLRNHIQSMKTDSVLQDLSVAAA